MTFLIALASKSLNSQKIHLLRQCFGVNDIDKELF